VGTLYVIGASLTRPEDVTLRALRILRQARLVVAGEPEQARQFLDRFDLHPRLIPVPQPGEGLDEVVGTLATEDVTLLQGEQSPVPSGPAGALIRTAVERGFRPCPSRTGVAPDQPCDLRPAGQQFCLSGVVIPKA